MSYIYLSSNPFISWAKNVNYLKLLCSHLHLFPCFLSIPNPFILSSSHCFTGSQTCQSESSQSLLHMEDFTSRNILFKSNLFLEVFSHSPVKPPPPCFHTKVSITALSIWSESYLLAPVFPTSQGALAGKVWSGLTCFYISRLSTEPSLE